MTRWKTLAALGLAVGLLAACGNGPTSGLDTVRNSSSTTLGKATTSLTFSQTSDASGSPVKSSGDGGYDFGANAGRLNLTVNGIPGVPDGSKAVAIIAGNTVYAHLLSGTDTLRKLGATAPWIKLDLLALSGIPGLDLGTIAQAQSANPKQFLFYLKGAANPIVKVGVEPVGGVSTTHYKFNVDVDEAARQSTPADAAIINKASASYATRSIPTEEWVDKAGLVRRVTYTLTVKPAPGKTTPVHQTTSFEFQQFGVPIDTAPPPADQVADLVTILAKLAGGG